MRELPSWKGLTIDVRLRQFRKVTFDPIPACEFIDFDSSLGRKLLAAYLKQRGET